MKQATNQYVQIYEGGPSVLETVVTGLAPGETYQFQITVSNVDQTSATWPANKFLQVGAPPLPPAAPSFVSALATVISIEWGEATSVLPILEYRLFFDGNTADVNPIVPVPGRRIGGRTINIV